MALTLIKTVDNNASGSVTPNCLVSGLFEYHQIGNLFINAPTMCPDGGIFAVKIVQKGTTGHSVTWDSGYLTQDELYAGGDGTDGTVECLHIFVHDDGQMRLIKSLLGG